MLILDAGPGSLGAPRLVQLALVLAAARRAHERGQVVAFGGMGRAEDGLVEGLSEASIRGMLSWRSHHEPPQDANVRWAAALGDAAIDGLWVCGDGDFARAAPPGWATVRVTEPFGEPDALVVELSRGGRALGGVGAVGGVDEALGPGQHHGEQRHGLGREAVELAGPGGEAGDHAPSQATKAARRRARQAESGSTRRGSGTTNKAPWGWAEALRRAARVKAGGSGQAKVVGTNSSAASGSAPK